MKDTRISWTPADLLPLLGVAAIYSITSWLVRLYFGEATIFFLSSGIALAALLIGGTSYFWAVWLGALIANLLVGSAFWVSTVMAFGSALAALIGTKLIVHRGQFDIQLPSLKNMIHVVSLGGFAGATVSAAIGMTALHLSGDRNADNYLGSMVHWWMGDTLGVLLMTPLILVWWPALSNPAMRPSANRVAEGLLILGMILLVGGIVFLNWGRETTPVWLLLLLNKAAQGYWMFLLVIWAAVRLGTRGTSIAVMLVAAMGVTGAIQETDLSNTPQVQPDLISFWGYSVILSLVGMALATYMAASRKITQSMVQREAAINQELKYVITALDQHAMVATTDATGQITDVNDKFCERSGYSRAELLGKNHRLLNSGLHSREFFETLYKTIGMGQVWSGEIRERAKDGHFFWVQTTITPFLGADGTPTKYIVIRADITALKEAEIELQRHRNHLEQLVRKKTDDLQSNVDMTLHTLNQLRQQKFVLDQHAIVSMCGIDGRITYGNDKFSEISGFTREEFMGQDHNLLNSGYHPHGFFKAMYQKIARGGVWHGEVCNRAKDGRLYWVDSTITAYMGDDGKPSEYIAVRTDITERKQAEEAAHAANQAKSEFLANMSHEIRTPMNGVVGMIDLLQQTVLQPEQHRMLETIHNSSLALLGILNDILDLSKIEADKLEIERIPTHLREVVEDVTLLMLNVANTKNAQIALFIDPTLPTWIISDPTRLRQILLNLLGNALKFIAQQTGIAVLHVQPVTSPDGATCVQFRITDNGIGMSEEVVAKLFQPFTQADASTARKFGGTGLGLSITHRLVDMLHGQIRVQSTPGTGSEFIVELPLQAAQTPPGRLRPIEPNLTGVHVLAVTPRSACATLFQAYLSAAGAQVTIEADLLGAYKHWQTSGHNTVVLLDLEGIEHSEADTPANEIKWPSEARIVRLARRSSPPTESSSIDIPARPLFYNDLIRGIALASRRVTSNNVTERRRTPRTKPPTVEEALAAKRLILLAEDNETNRDVLLEQLRLLGYAAEVAQDGAMALHMWRTGRYALLLTDCHMPNMDGFELTKAIRQLEPDNTHLPIIAITANAMQGEVQRCRARGMDDYLSKPLRLNELGPMLAKWLPLLPAAPSSTPSASQQAATLPLWDETTLGQLMGNNPASQRRLLEKFVINARAQVTAITTATAAGAVSAVVGEAHTLKSAARSVGALLLGELCQAMETAALAGDQQQCEKLVQDLPTAYAAAAEAIHQHLTYINVTTAGP